MQKKVRAAIIISDKGDLRENYQRWRGYYIMPQRHSSPKCGKTIQQSCKYKQKLIGLKGEVDRYTIRVDTSISLSKTDTSSQKISKYTEHNQPTVSHFHL